MLIYPQLANGALSHFPIQKRHCFRTLVNEAADGTSLKLADPGAESVEWQLNYSALSDTELQNLIAFFEAAEGSLNGFTFVDPNANLLGWSGDLSNAVWNKGPLLTATGGVADPSEGCQAWRLSNGGAGAQQLLQTLTAPGGYTYCFSVYARSAQASTATLLLGKSRYERAIEASWHRISCSSADDAAAETVTFGIEVPSGSAIEVFGIQAEAQPTPSIYKPSTSGGCYENARLRDDLLSFTTTGVNRHSATVNIFHASHL